MEKEIELKKIENVMGRLSKSKFRSSFKLKDIDIKYVKDKGMDTIKRHAYDFITKRLAPKDIKNDGKQTPMKGHPVFIAQHATATCCRTCLYKWHHIPKDKQLSQEEIDYVVNIIIKWINREINSK